MPGGNKQGEEIVSIQFDHLCTLWLGIDVVKGFSCFVYNFCPFGVAKTNKARNKIEMIQRGYVFHCKPLLKYFCPQLQLLFDIVLSL